MATLGRACLILALRRRASTASAPALYGAWRLHRRDLAASGAPRGLRARRRSLTIAIRVLEIAFLRYDFSFDVVATHSSTTTPLFYKRRRGVVLAGGLAAAVGLAAGAVVEPRAVPDAPAHARRRRRSRPRCCCGFGAFFAGLLVFAACAVRRARVAAAGRGSGSTRCCATRR